MVLGDKRRNYVTDVLSLMRILAKKITVTDVDGAGDCVMAAEYIKRQFNPKDEKLRRLTVCGDIFDGGRMFSTWCERHGDFALHMPYRDAGLGGRRHASVVYLLHAFTVYYSRVGHENARLSHTDWCTDCGPDAQRVRVASSVVCILH